MFKETCDADSAEKVHVRISANSKPATHIVRSFESGNRKNPLQFDPEGLVSESMREQAQFLSALVKNNPSVHV